jgi:tRNA U38,U39,U40 pseudouridine synthase TruA
VDINQIVNEFDLTLEQVRKMILSNIYSEDKKINVVKIINLLNKNRWKISDSIKYNVLKYK